MRRREGFRVTHYSVQGNHVHMIVEASDRRSMSNGLRALLIRFARTLNRVMHARGSRFADRYYETVLRTASAVRRCIGYVLENFKPAVAANASYPGEKNSKNHGLVQAVADTNAKLAAKMLTDRSAVLKELVDAKQLVIVAAMHDLSTGKVSFFS